MSMTLEKVTNIGVRLTDGKIIPAIRAVLSDYTGYHSAEDMNFLYEEIIENAKGCVSACGYFTSGLEATHDYLPLETGTYIYGTDAGFKYEYRVTTRTSGLNKSQYISGYLDYKGERVGKALNYTSIGENEYEVGYLIILTDDDYNLIGESGQYVEGPQVLYLSSPGATLVNDVPVCGVYEGSFRSYTGAMTLSLIEDGNIKDDITGEIDPSEIDPDPYDPGGNTDPGGGDGDHDLDSDDIDIPPVPTLSAADTGFITLFNPSAAQLKSLANYMWSGPFDLATYKKIFADPMDCILGLSIVPVAVPNAGLSPVTVGNISTGISMNKASSQYVEVDCGSITVNEYWGAYLDYAPYTKAEIYLPYIGAHAIDIDDIMKKTIKVVYHVDVLSGSCCAYVKCGSSVLYSFLGQCASSIPISGNDWTNVVNGVLQIAGSIGTMVATGGATAPMAVGQIAATSVNSMKPAVEKSGSLSGTGGMLGIQKPYLIITRPKQAVPQGQSQFMGYPSFITSMLSALSGYTVMEEVHLNNISATDDELNEIEELLKTGVIL